MAASRLGNALVLGGVGLDVLCPAMDVRRGDGTEAGLDLGRGAGRLFRASIPGC